MERTDAQAARRGLQTVWSAEADRVPDLERRRAAEPERQRWLTRALNFVLALLALVSLVPVMLIEASRVPRAPDLGDFV